MDDPASAIWMATIATRMVLSHRKHTSEFFVIGKNIKSPLRWKINSCNHSLSVQSAV